MFFFFFPCFVSKLDCKDHLIPFVGRTRNGLLVYSIVVVFFSLCGFLALVKWQSVPLMWRGHLVLLVLFKFFFFLIFGFTPTRRPGRVLCRNKFLRGYSTPNPIIFVFCGTRRKRYTKTEHLHYTDVAFLFYFYIFVLPFFLFFLLLLQPLRFFIFLILNLTSSGTGKMFGAFVLKESYKNRNRKGKWDGGKGRRLEKLAVKKKKCSGFEKEKSFSFIFVPIFVCLRVGAATEGNAVKKKTQPDSLHTSFFFCVCCFLWKPPTAS